MSTTRKMKFSFIAVAALALIVSLSLVNCGSSGGGGASSPPKTNVYRAYVADSSGQSIMGYTIDQTSGALTSTGTTTLGSWPHSIVADLQGRFVYVAHASGNMVSAFTINASTGALTSAGTSTTGGNTVYVNTDPLSRFLYATNWNTNDVVIFTINASSGALTKTNCGGGAGCNGMNFAVGVLPYSNTAFDPAGKYAYMAIQGAHVVARFAIDQTTGALSSKITATAGTTPNYVAIEPQGKFAYVTNATSNDVSAYIISAATGTLSQIDCGGGAGCSIANSKNFAAGTYPNSIAIDPASKFLYVANANANTVSAFTINGTTGALTAIAGSPYSVGAGASGCLSVDTDPSGKFLYATNYLNNYVAGFAINGTTGELTSLAGTPFATGVQAYFISTTITSY